MPFSFRRRRKDETSHHDNNNEEDDSSPNDKHKQQQHAANHHPLIIPLHEETSPKTKPITAAARPQFSRSNTALLPVSSSSTLLSSPSSTSASGSFQHPLGRHGRSSSSGSGGSGKASSFLSWLGYHMKRKTGNSSPSSSTSSSLSSSAQSINVSNCSINLESNHGLLYHDDDDENNNHMNAGSSSTLLHPTMDGNEHATDITTNHHHDHFHSATQQQEGVHGLLLSITDTSQAHYIVDQHQNPQQYHQLHSLLKKRNHHLKLPGSHHESNAFKSASTSLEEKNLSLKNLSSEDNGITSPRLVVSSPTGAEKVLSPDEFYHGFVDDIISDSDHSDVLCFSPPATDDILHEAQMLSNAYNHHILPTSSTTTDEQQQRVEELDPVMLEFEDWFKKFEIGADNEGNGTVDLNATVRKKSRAKSLSKFVTAMSEPFVHTGSSTKSKVKTLSPKSSNNIIDVFQTSDDTSATGGALIINENENEQHDKGRFSRSFKNLVLLARKHPASSPPHIASAEKQAQQVIIQKSIFLTALPQEIKNYIFQFLEFKFILSIRLVCKEFKDIADDNTIWEPLCTEHSLDFSMVSYKHLKQLYIENQVFVTVVGTEEVGKSLLIKRCSNNPALLLESFVVGPRRLYDSVYIHDEEPYYIYFREINKENKSLLKSHAIKEDMFFVCFSIFDKRSFSKTKKLIREIRAKSKTTKPIILVGMKIDLRDEEGSEQVKLIKTEQGEEYKTRFKLFSYREISNKTRVGISDLLVDAINAKRIQMEKFYNYEKALGTEAELEDISEDIFNYSDDDEDHEMVGGQAGITVSTNNDDALTTCHNAFEPTAIDNNESHNG
ncbi:hypothetical protein C9374_007645 [Naegleria lovaniensis]|uniref:F-box domain-containing protein n=1 Tax=Naegleria lovaniensis TaxID=51637 RepID=A0AA88GKE7_NAELO|nr:uncharacterized protein C9374_007645 [Naegleria lovaniensis]KAG2379007.1 hypothetical protein C9374_007645 [Naegleria lovaniensis]